MKEFFIEQADNGIIVVVSERVAGAPQYNGMCAKKYAFQTFEAFVAWAQRELKFAGEKK